MEERVLEPQLFLRGGFFARAEDAEILNLPQFDQIFEWNGL